jgi:hypothetical protein
VPHLLCASDPETMRMADLLSLADDQSRLRWEQLTLGYTETSGHPLLRAEIGETYEALSPEDVLVCSGARRRSSSRCAPWRPGRHAVVVWSPTNR